jgi:hypothetical protein
VLLQSEKTEKAGSAQKEEIELNSTVRGCGVKPDQDVANTVIEFSLDNPHLGQVQVSKQLQKDYQIELSASGVRNVWLRENMQTCALRLQKKESLLAAT